MKKIVLLLFICSQVLFSQIQPDWDINPPRDTEQHKYAIGISQPSATEQSAWNSARQNAVQQFAASIATRFQSQVDISVESQYFSSGIEDAYTVYMETSSFSTNVSISGVTEEARRIEIRNGQYIARILAVMGIEDYNRARQQVENEESAFLAYRYFSQRGAIAENLGQDYYSWLRNNCILLTVATDNQMPYLEQLDLFTRKLYRNSLVFPERLNDQPVRIIYDSSRYYAGILRALESSNAFSIRRESALLVLAPSGANALTDFRNYVAEMKDSSRIFVIGNELIQTENFTHINTGNAFVNQFRNIASSDYGLTSVTFNLPASFTNSEYFDLYGIINYIRMNEISFPARYAAICSVETILESSLARFNNRPNIVASGTFVLFDVLTGEIHYSDRVDTAGFIFNPANITDQSIINESRRAIQFLFDPRNQPGLKGIMDNVLSQL